MREPHCNELLSGTNEIYLKLSGVKNNRVPDGLDRFRRNGILIIITYTLFRELFCVGKTIVQNQLLLFLLSMRYRFGPRLTLLLLFFSEFLARKLWVFLFLALKYTCHNVTAEYI